MKRFLAAPFWLLSVHCAQLQSDFREAALAAGGAADGSNCRTYVTAYVNGGNNYACSWNKDTLQYICSGNGNTYTYQYPSQRKFVDETKVLGRTFLSTATITGSGASTTVYSYDASDRLTTMFISAGTASLTYSYSTFDGQGRPTAGLYNISASGFSCVNAVIAQSYNDGARTVSQTISGGAGILCTPISSTTTYDTETGAATTTVASPGGTSTNTLTGKAQFCL